MTAHLAQAAFWLVLLGAQWLRLRPRRRRQLAAVLSRRWTSARRTVAALGRAVTFHPRKARHASPERTA